MGWIQNKQKLKPIYVCSVYRPSAARGNEVDLVHKYKDFIISSSDRESPEI